MIYPRRLIFSHRRGKLQSNSLRRTRVAPKNTSVSILVSRETYWSAAQMGVIYLTVQMIRTVVLSKENSTVKVLKCFPEIYRPYVNNCIE
jgi:hypothetical protein